MASKTNLFGFEQREPNSSVDATLIFEKINKELGEHLQKVSTPIQQTVFLTS